MKVLDVPYIGVKIESLYTILKVLSESSSDADFTNYYKNLGKSEKTATEYLASLRNLKLAIRGNGGNTILLPAGKFLLEDRVELLYKNLIKHCIKNFPDLKIVKDLMMSSKAQSLPELINTLSINGYYIKRIQTLSSYFKLFFEGQNLNPKSLRNPFLSNKSEVLEYNQFLKLLKRYAFINKSKKIRIPDVYRWINEKYSISRETFDQYLSIVKSDSKIKFYEVNPIILKDPSDAFIQNSKSYLFIELL